MRYLEAVVCALLLAAAPALAQEKLKVVATFSILGDFVRQVGGDRVELTTLVGPDGDAHVYQPTPADAKAVAQAKLVVINGIGLEGWFERFIKASGANPPITIASHSARLMASGGDQPKGARPAPEGGHGHGAFDPHAWQDVANAKAYVREIESGLEAADPAGKEVYSANAAAYVAKLDQLDIDVKAGIAAIPAARRRVITTHDAFGYFARAYGIVFIAPQGVSTEAEPSAKDVARIIRQIRAEKIPAVFLENIADERLMRQIAKESGAAVGGKVFSDALSGPDGPASTYIDMMRNNLAQFAKALGGQS